jgi:hypothetical protein
MSAPKDVEQHHEHGHHVQVLRDGRDPKLPANHPVNAYSSLKKFSILAVLTYCGFLANFRFVNLDRRGMC